jgi:hypothetical protein
MHIGAAVPDCSRSVPLLCLTIFEIYNGIMIFNWIVLSLWLCFLSDGLIIGYCENPTAYEISHRTFHCYYCDVW